MTEQQEVITFAVDTAKLEERIITGIAAPYGEITTKGGHRLRFEQGLFADAKEAFLYFNHDVSLAPIGKVFSIEDTEAGLSIKAKISKTSRGDEIYELLKDGVLDKFSVGAIAKTVRLDDDVEVWTAAELTEISVVPKPAFKNAAVAQVHSADTHTKEVVSDDMTNVENGGVVELTGRVEDLERKFALVDRNEGPVVSKFNNGGEFLKALARGDEAAKNEIKFDAGTTVEADVTRPGWVNRLIPVVDRGRPVLNLFNKAPLPPTGNSVEYPVLDSTSGDVAAQTEGANLAYIEVALDTATAPVVTYGGYSAVTRQAIERSDIAYLDTVLRVQAASYAKVTNAAVRTALTGASGVTTGTPLTVDSAGNWLGLVLEAISEIEDNGQGAQADVMVMGTAVFARVAGLLDDNARVQFDVNGDGVNTIGNLNFRGIRGSLAGLPIAVDAGLSGDTVYVASQDALTVFESPGAPFRLQDENIINLTKEFSLYGYMAIGVTNPGGIVKVVTTLA